MYSDTYHNCTRAQALKHDASRGLRLLAQVKRAVRRREARDADVASAGAEVKGALERGETVEVFGAALMSFKRAVQRQKLARQEVEALALATGALVQRAADEWGLDARAFAQAAIRERVTRRTSRTLRHRVARGRRERRVRTSRASTRAAPPVPEPPHAATVAAMVEAIVEGVRRLGATSAGQLEVVASRAPTLGAFAKRWTSGELHREFPDHVKDIGQDDNRERLACMLATSVDGWGTLAEVPIDLVTLDHGMAAMRSIPADASPTTRAHYARALSRVLSLAVMPGRLIKASPLPKGFVPRTPKPPARAWWKPADDAALARAASTAVPLVYRLFYAFVFREGLRASEAAGLRWKDVAGKSLALDENKTGDARAWALYPGTTEALAAWRKVVASVGLPTGDEAPVFVHVRGPARGKPLHVKHLADDFQRHVREAGLWRAEFDKAPNRKQLRFHDVRAGFVSWALATGRTETWVQDRTGHTNTAMIARYRRQARHAEELGVEPPCSLLDAIPELAGAADVGRGGGTSKSRASAASSNGRRVQNPPSERA